jgi:hypothetical protein
VGQITQVGYQLGDTFSQKFFDQIRADSGDLASLKQAVLDSANDWVGLGAPPDKGAKWTDPRQNVKYNVRYKFSPVDPKSATTAIVTQIEARG